MKKVLTSKHQVHIPKQLREAVGLEDQAVVEMATDGKVITLRPINESVLDLAGTMRVKQPIPAEEIRPKLAYDTK